MDLSKLTDESITKFGGNTYGCECQKTHSAATRNIYFESGACQKTGAAAARIVPPPSLIGIITDSAAKLAVERTVEKSLAAAGFRIVCREFDDPPSGCIKDCLSAGFPEDTRLILGVGGGAVPDIAKYVAKACRIPAALVLTQTDGLTALSQTSSLLSDGIERVYKTCAPEFIIADTDIISRCPSSYTASAMGRLCAKLISLFDWYFSHIVNGEYFCANIYEQAFEIIETAVFAVIKAVKEGRNANVLLSEQCLKFSALTQLCGSSRIINGADSQASHALELLFKFEEREIKSRGENEFLFGRIIIKMYKQVILQKKDFFLPPPDNNLRLEKLTEYFGLQELAAAKLLRPLEPAVNTKLTLYRVGEYRAELFSQCCRIDSLFTAAWPAFKRLYEDDGFSLINYLDKTDISLSLALAPDVKDRFTMLAFMKNAGYLEGYLDDAI